MSVTKFKEVRIRASVLEDLVQSLESTIDRCYKVYQQVGENEDGSPKYGYVERDEAELSEDDRIKIMVCKELIDALENIL